MTQSQQAIILFGHGSRDPRWAQTLHAVAKQLQSDHPTRVVRCAYLEFMQPGLPETLRSLYAEGLKHVRVAPVFLAAGGHVLRDLPDRAAGLRAAFPGLSVQIEPALGASESVIEAMPQVCMDAVSIPHDRIAQSLVSGRAPGAIGAAD